MRKPKGWCNREGFSFVSNTDQEFQQDRAFVAGKPLQPNLMFEGYANSLSNRESAKMSSICVRLDLILKYYTWVKRPTMTKIVASLSIASMMNKNVL